MSTLRSPQIIYLLCVIVHFRPTTSIIYNGSIQIDSNASFRLFEQDAIWSTTNTAQFILQLEGNLVFRRYTPSHSNNAAVWASDTQTQGGSNKHVEIGTNGNIMIKELSHNLKITTLWESYTSTDTSTFPLELVVTDNCPYLYNTNRDIVWTPCSACDDGRIIDTRIEQWQYITIPINGSYKMCPDDRIYSRYSRHEGTLFQFRNEGALSLTNLTHEPEITGDLFETEHTSAVYAEFNHNGNIMLKDANDIIQWQSNTSNTAQVHLSLVVEDYCVYLRNTDEIIWQEGNCTEPYITTFSPTNPTISSTGYPTDIPSTIASSSTPTLTPMTSPVHFPTTDIPSTIAPASTPTSTPMTPLVPTVSPVYISTPSSTANPTVISSQFMTESSVVDAVDYTENKEDYSLFVVILSTIMCCICAAAIIVIVLRKSKRTSNGDFPPMSQPPMTKVISVSAMGSDKNEAIVLESADNKVTCEGSAVNVLNVDQNETQRDIVSETKGNIAPDEFEIIGEDEVGEDHHQTLRPEGEPVIIVISETVK
eukprot:826033_1